MKEERDYTHELEAARALAQEVSSLALERFSTGVTAERKLDGTWVTQADTDVEAALRERLAELFPEHNILGEEQGFMAADGGPAKEGAPTWVVDPIDGTNNFMAGIPIWGTLIGLTDAGEAVVGVAHAPALGETYDAAVGLGARLNGEPIAVSPVAELAEALVVSTGAEAMRKRGLGAFYDALVDSSYRSRGFGDFWGHVLVARGAAQVMVEPELNMWDYAPLVPIVTEAGGRMSRLDGGRLVDGGSCLTTNTALHESVVELARRQAPGWKENSPSGS